MGVLNEEQYAEDAASYAGDYVARIMDGTLVLEEVDDIVINLELDNEQ